VTTSSNESLGSVAKTVVKQLLGSLGGWDCVSRSVSCQLMCH
jgi:hypothetical protein